MVVVRARQVVGVRVGVVETGILFGAADVVVVVVAFRFPERAEQLLEGRLTLNLALTELAEVVGVALAVGTRARRRHLGGGGVLDDDSTVSTGGGAGAPLRRTLDVLVHFDGSGTDRLRWIVTHWTRGNHRHSMQLKQFTR